MSELGNGIRAGARRGYGNRMPVRYPLVFPLTICADLGGQYEGSFMIKCRLGIQGSQFPCSLWYSEHHRTMKRLQCNRGQVELVVRRPYVSIECLE